MTVSLNILEGVVAVRKALVVLLMLAPAGTAYGQSDVDASVQLFDDVCMSDSNFFALRQAVLEDADEAIAGRVSAAFTSAGMSKVDGQPGYWRGQGRLGHVSGTNCEVALPATTSQSEVERALAPRLSGWAPTEATYGGLAWVSERHPGYVLELWTSDIVTVSLTFAPTARAQVHIFQTVCLRRWAENLREDPGPYLSTMGLRQVPNSAPLAMGETWRGRGFEVKLDSRRCSVAVPTSVARPVVDQTLRPRMSAWRLEEDVDGSLWRLDLPSFDLGVQIYYDRDTTKLSLWSREVLDR